jgi:hypothetical protein
LELNVLYAIVLFCALAVSPENCDEGSASHYEHVPGGNTQSLGCFMQAETWVAEHGITPNPGEYAKVRCSRHEFGHPTG